MLISKLVIYFILILLGQKIIDKNIKKLSRKAKDFDFYTKVSNQESKYDFGIKLGYRQMANRYKQSTRKLVAMRNRKFNRNISIAESVDLSFE